MTRTSSRTTASPVARRPAGTEASDRRGADAPGRRRERSQRVGRVTNTDIVSSSRSLPEWLSSGSRALVCVSVNVAKRQRGQHDAAPCPSQARPTACPAAVRGRGLQPRRRARRSLLPGVDTPRRRTPGALSQRQELAAGAPTSRIREAQGGCTWRNRQPAFTTPRLSGRHTLGRLVFISGASQLTRNERQQGSTCLPVSAPAAHPSRAHHYSTIEAGMAQSVTTKEWDAEICGGRRVRAGAGSD
jgi:hypothetical protein